MEAIQNRDGLPSTADSVQRPPRPYTASPFRSTGGRLASADAAMITHRKTAQRNADFQQQDGNGDHEILLLLFHQFLERLRHGVGPRLIALVREMHPVEHQLS